MTIELSSQEMCDWANANMERVEELERQIEAKNERIAELEKAIRGYVRATTRQENVTIHFQIQENDV